MTWTADPVVSLYAALATETPGDPFFTVPLRIVIGWESLQGLADFLAVPNSSSGLHWSKILDLVQKDMTLPERDPKKWQGKMNQNTV